MSLFQNTKVALILIILLLVASAMVIFYKPPVLGLDLSGGTRLTVEAVDPADKKLTDDEKVLAMDALVQIIQRRIDSAGVSEIIVQRAGEKRLIIEIPGEHDPERAKARIGKTGLLEFRRQVIKEGKTAWIASGVSGRDMKSADVAAGNAGDWHISFALNGEGTEKFRKLTEELVVGHQPLGIFFDGQFVSAPAVQSVIGGGAGQITGDFSYEEAKEMVDTLNAGALPMDIDFIEESSVGPLLGAASVQKSFLAGLGGLGLVLIFMLFYYRIQGLVANLALVVYTLLTYAAYNFFGVTFTLAGIAGFILSIGMAVDANILIFERTKEEIKSGRSLRKAIEVGFDRAFPSIFDSNTTTIITCALLWILGTGSVKGFAITLAIGVVISMFSAITVTRTLMFIILGSGGQVTNPAMFGIKSEDIKAS